MFIMTRCNLGMLTQFCIFSDIISNAGRRGDVASLYIFTRLLLYDIKFGVGITCIIYRLSANVPCILFIFNSDMIIYVDKITRL